MAKLGLAKVGISHTNVGISRWASQVDEIGRNVFGHSQCHSQRDDCRSEWKERQHGAWLRVDQWPTALGRHPRLRCGVLFHVATAPSHFLMMQCNSCCHSSRIGCVLLSLSCLPCNCQVLVLNLIALRPVVPSRHLSPFLAVPQSGGAVPQLRPTAVPSPPSDNHSSTGVAGSTPSEVSVLRGLVHQLINVCQSNQQQLSLLRGEVSQLRDELRAVRATPVPSSQAASVHHSRFPSDATCYFAGCSQQVSARCPVQFCRAHCTSSRCKVHTGRSPSRSHQRVLRSPLHEPALQMHRGPVCSSSGCGEVPSPGCVGGMCETHAALLHPRLPPLPDIIRTAVS